MCFVDVCQWMVCLGERGEPEEGGWLLDATGIVSRRRWTLANASTEEVKVESGKGWQGGCAVLLRLRLSRPAPTQRNHSLGCWGRGSLRALRGGWCSPLIRRRRRVTDVDALLSTCASAGWYGRGWFHDHKEKLKMRCT